MKEDLVKLIEDTEHIKTKFHSTGGQGLPVHNVIYDNADFTLWKREVQLELQEIYDRTSDQFIWDILVLIKQGFNSWKDEKSFNELQGGLRAIYKNIDKYYPNSIQNSVLLEESQMVVKKPKILILDDSVSALDSTTELKLRTALKEEFKDTTIIMIVQKISSCREVDRVLVIDDGTVVGNGSHSDLIENNTIYKEISESQKEVMP